MQHIKHFLVILNVIIVILGSCVACGVPSSKTINNNVSSTGQQAMATFTPNAVILTKQAFVSAQATQEAADQGTIQSGGELATPVGTIPPHVIEFQTQVALGYTPTPVPLPPEGLEPDCGYTDHTYRYGNCWNMNHSNISYFMLAGSFNNDVTQGVLSLELDGTTLSIMQRQPVDYPTPQKAGKIEVESATWPLVRVRTQTQPRTYFTFNLETRQWVTNNGTPIPTVTPRDKFDYATQQARAIATERVMEWPTVPAITFAPATEIPQPTGFLDDCFYTMLRGFIPRNCWREQLPNGEYIGIYAGYGKNNDDGLLYITGHDPTGIVADGTPADYILSGTLGSFKILSVNYPIVNLDVRGKTFQFALDTRQWVTASGTPISTVTPTATKIAR